MKARVKATGEIVEVTPKSYYTRKEGMYLKFTDEEGISYLEDELDFYVEGKDPDYWTRLEHTYAGMAMQGILSNQDYCKLLIDENNKGSFAEDVSRCAKDIAHVLVQKLKKKEEK